MRYEKVIKDTTVMRWLKNADNDLDSVVEYRKDGYAIMLFRYLGKPSKFVRMAINSLKKLKPSEYILS